MRIKARFILLCKFADKLTRSQNDIIIGPMIFWLKLLVTLRWNSSKDTEDERLRCGGIHVGTVVRASKASWSAAKLRRGLAGKDVCTATGAEHTR